MEYVANCKYVACMNTSLVTMQAPPIKLGKGAVTFAEFLVCAESAYHSQLDITYRNPSW